MATLALSLLGHGSMKGGAFQKAIRRCPSSGMLFLRATNQPQSRHGSLPADLPHGAGQVPGVEA